MTREATWSYARWGIAAAGLSLLLLVLQGSPSPARAILAGVFLLLAPGLVVTRLIGIHDALLALALAVAASISLDGIAAGLTLYGGLWSPQRTLMVVVELTLTGVAFDGLRHSDRFAYALGQAGRPLDAVLRQLRGTQSWLRPGNGHNPHRQAPTPAADTLRPQLVPDLDCFSGLLVSSTLDGDVRTGGDVVITPEGHVRANIVARRVLIGGRVDGDVQCSELELQPGGILTGNVSAASLIVAPGSCFEGHATVGGRDVDGQQHAGTRLLHPLSVPAARPAEV